MFQSLDHIAIVVQDTEAALAFYRDQLGFPLVLSEVIEEAGVRLTHLDLGNVHLQLVQPLSEDHPLREFLAQHGEGVHHLCLRVGSVGQTIAGLREKGWVAHDTRPHRGPRGRNAAFLDPAATRGVRWEITSEPEARQP
jgi:methylmalonyl-CoA/ethylmalonyl-CoA epimerase